MLNKLKKNQYSIIQGFLDKVLSIPSNIALVSNNIKYTYRDLFLMAFFLKKKIFIRKIIFHSKNKYLCRKYIDTNSVLVKFLDTYVVFKKIL